MLAHGYIHGLLAPRQDGLAEGPAEESCLGHGGQEAEGKVWSSGREKRSQASLHCSASSHCTPFPSASHM